MGNTDKKKRFLALTALEKFWDTSASLVFLGDWCKLYEKKSLWENANATMMDFSSLASKPEEIHGQLIQVYDEVLAQLVSWLNTIHHTQHSQAYWQILIGPFLYWYIQAVYNRYAAIKNAYTLYPDAQTSGIAPKAYWTPLNTAEFYELVIHSHAWNLQLFSQIIALHFPQSIDYQDYHWCEELKARPSFKKQTVKKKWLNRCVATVQMYAVRFFLKCWGKKAIGLNHLLFSKKNILWLMFSSKGKILPVFPFLEAKLTTKEREVDRPNTVLRSEINALPTKDPLVRLIFHTLQFNMPLNFIENYRFECHKAKSHYPYTVKSLFGYYMQDDPAKFFAASCKESNSQIVMMQHGGGYGALKYHSSSFIEERNSDVFLSWGWQYSPHILPVASISMSKMIADKKACTLEKSQHILWVATEFTPFALEAASNHVNQKYFDDQYAFAKALSPTTFARTILRLRHSKWSDKWKFLQEALPNLKMYQPKADASCFFNQLITASIVVVDNLNTVHLYALGLNIPTIIFWDKDIHTLREEAKPYFAALHRAGIYHDSPESAAAQLNQIAADPLTWWQSESVQAARRYYCDHFAKASEHWLKDWSQLLLTIADGQTRKNASVAAANKNA